MNTNDPKIQAPTRRRVAVVKVQPYLAAYARIKFDVDQKTGGIIIPDSFDLYHCVWQNMAKWPLERWHCGVSRPVDPPDGNLLIHLPFRRTEGGVAKDPRFWNYISPRAASVINRELKRLFDWEFHHYVENMLECSSSITKKEAVTCFSRKYGLGIDAEDTLLKNFQRYERRNRIFLSLKKHKSTTTSTPTLSCRIPPLLMLRPDLGDGAYCFGQENPLARLIADGLRRLDGSALEDDTP